MFYFILTMTISCSKLSIDIIKKVSTLQKIINLRSIFFLFLLTVVCIFCFSKVTNNLFYLFLIIIPILYFIFLIVKRKFILLTVSIILLTYISLYTFFYIKNYSDKSILNQEYTVSGRVSDIYKVNDNFAYYTLEDVSIKKENNLNKNLKGNLSVPVNNYDNIFCDIGYYISCSIKLSYIPLINDENSINSLYLKNNIRYEASKPINLKNASIFYGNKYLDESIKEYNKNILVNTLGEDDGNLAIAVLYGDKGNVNEDLLSIFKQSGVMHIFAVSGLHIGLIIALLVLLLNKLKINKKWQFIISTIVLGVFCYLCSFSSPVVRASIMALTVLFAKILGRKDDKLNTISLSALIILVLNPINLYDGGFQMTFVAVFGILLFGDIFKKVKIKNNILKKIFLLIATSLSTQLALLPLLANFYGYYATWSILANLFTLPIFTVFYILLFIINLFVLILPFLNFLLLLPKALLNVIVYINLLITKLPFGIIKTYSWSNIAIISYFLFIFSISKFLILNIKVKVVVSSLLFVISLAFILSSTIPVKSKEDNIYFKDYIQAGYTTLLTTRNNNFFILNPDFSYTGIRKLKSTLNLNKISKIDGILLGFQQEFESKDTIKFLNDFNTTFYLPENHIAIENLNSIGINVKVINFNQPFLIDNIQLTYLSCQNQFYGCLFNFNNKKVLEINMDSISLNQNFIEYLNSHLNFYLNCVRIYNTEEKYDFKDVFNTNNIIFSGI